MDLKRKEVSLFQSVPTLALPRRHSVDEVQRFLEDHKLGKYCPAFLGHRVDGELLLEAGEEVLRELGVSSAVDRVKIRTKFKAFAASK